MFINKDTKCHILMGKKEKRENTAVFSKWTKIEMSKTHTKN